ncbi:6,7-dimethyl-8-ribityllumazine synthase [Planctomycetota bacterium]
MSRDLSTIPPDSNGITQFKKLIMTRKLAGSLEGGPLRIGIAVSRFNENITQPLLEGALAELKSLGVADSNVTMAQVPGAVELPLALSQMAASKNYDALVALGCVIRGGTPHFDYVCRITSDGCCQVSLEYGIPVGFGVLTCDTLAQAQERSDINALQSAAGAKESGGATNKGMEAARTAVEMANLAKKLREQK